jgi:hypothetical protein
VIFGYPAESSVDPGSTLTLHVSTDAPGFHTAFFRQGAAFDALGDLGLPTNSGVSVPFHPADQDWGLDGIDAAGDQLPAWPAYEFPVPVEWRTGAYVAVFTELDESGNALSEPDTSTADGRDSRALFVVRNPDPGTARILYKLPLFTWQAYNMTGDPQGSLYLDGGNHGVSLRRPGGGTGGVPTDTFTFPDVYDQSSPRETFAHWDADFIAWLERNDYPVDYCTDLDVHRGSDGLDGGYRLILSVGHDEYWSSAMRERVAGFVDGGGNAAFFSGNTCWWEVDFPDVEHMVFDRPVTWWERDQPENTLTGVSYRNGGGHWDGPRPQVVGYTVQHADHWVFDGTGLTDGDVIGDFYPDDLSEPAALVGYECDGAAFDRAQLNGGPVTPTGEDETPADFLILGVADVTGWTDFPGGNQAATMGLVTRAGATFTAATSDWSRVLNSGRHPTVEHMTRNVLDTLSA